MIGGIIGKLLKLENPGIIQEISGIQIILYRRFGDIIPALSIIISPVGFSHGFAYQISVLIILRNDCFLPVEPRILLYENPIGMRLLQTH